jgi:hypothetical protein
VRGDVPKSRLRGEKKMAKMEKEDTLKTKTHRRKEEVEVRMSWKGRLQKTIRAEGAGGKDSAPLHVTST